MNNNLFVIVFVFSCSALVILTILFAINYFSVVERYVCYNDVTGRKGTFDVWCVKETDFCRYCEYRGRIYFTGVDKYLQKDSFNFSFNITR